MTKTYADIVKLNIKEKEKPFFELLKDFGLSIDICEKLSDLYYFDNEDTFINYVRELIDNLKQHSQSKDLINVLNIFIT